MSDDVQPMEDSVVEVVTLDDAISTVSEVLDQNRESEDAAWDSLAHSFESLSSDVATLSQDVSSVGDDVSALRGEVSDSRQAEGETVYVALTEDQWQTVQTSWRWAKSAMSTALFLVLLLMLLTAALLGTRLWSEFSRGWRR